ncbi:hypothetical protein HYT25_03450 [Candidatus Pacearchaeota archaeon]|nr:hypothetical protein [Candidatus Pacearchaeota archaeon]
MKKAVLSLFLFLMIVSFLANLTFAQIQECEPDDDDCKIDNGYICLQDKIDTRTCSSLTSEEKVFSLIATGDCKSEVTSDSNFKTNTALGIKYTSLAFLGGASTSGDKDWLISKNRTADNIDWLLQIDTAETGTLACKVSYGTSFQDVTFNEDKTIASVALGTCVDENSVGDYWLKISQTCFNKDIKTSCDKSFTTNLLYQKQGTSTIYVSEETHSSSSGGETTEKVKSLCFGTSGSTGECKYEASLWAAFILSNSFNYDVSAFIPYLVINMDTGTNDDFLPEAFLYLLTGKFQNELLSKQKPGNWWQESSDKYYDTALALYFLQNDDPLEKQDAIDWLLDENTQGADGCWNSGNVKDTAFILHALDPRTPSLRSTTPPPIDSNITPANITSCESAGFFCMSGISCSLAEGDVLSSSIYSCSGTSVCCDRQRILETCDEQGGQICTSSQDCVGGSEGDASDISSGEICCISGTCEIPSEEEESQCEAAGGECRRSSSGCLSGETESSEQCEFSSDICCIKETKIRGISAFWIWTLVILIIFAALGILFRERLRHLWFRIKSGSGHGMPPSYPRRPPFNPPAIFPRRVVPTQPQQHHVPQEHHPQKHGELSEVLKKLKDMGK